MTPPFRNPILWLRRIRKRCGYGVHSPFAFGLLENVVYERLPYYAFEELDARLVWWQRFRVRRYLHLLFRLTNYQHPAVIVLGKCDALERAYLTSACAQAAVRKMTEIDDGTERARLFFLAEPDDAVLAELRSGDMLLLANVHRYEAWWDRLPKVVGFDLYDLGIAFFDTQYNEQNYVINF